MFAVTLVGATLAPDRAAARIGGFETSVDEATGASMYAVPIVTPPGPAGTAPGFALRYASGDGRGAAGWLGFGWRLEGESRIRRNTRRGVPYDYAAGPVCGGAFCYLDDFEFDGSDLVCADLACSSGLYKTRVDDGRRIRFLGSNGGWQVHDREGRVHVYGASASHRLVNPANGQVHSWLLERIEDRNANWIAYSYDVAPGAAYLRRVEYAQAGAAANRTLEFLREPRPDSAPDYRGGFREQVRERLVRIEVRADPGGLVTAYELGYAQGPTSGRSLLASVRRLGADDDPATALPPHLFEYSHREVDPTDGALIGFEDAATSFEEATQISFVGLMSVYGEAGLADLNGDAITDYYWANAGIQEVVWAYLSNGSRFDLPVLWYDEYLPFWRGVSESDRSGLIRSTLDIDGDGRADHVRRGEVRLGTVGGFAPAIPWNFSPDDVPGGLPLAARPSGPVLTWSSDDDVFMTLLDLTGDGRPDRVHCKYASQGWTSGATGWNVYLNLGLDAGGAAGGFSQVPIDWTDPMDLPCARGSYQAQALQQTPVDVATVDVNGDGLPDHLRSGVAGMYVAFNNGSGFDPEERALDVAYRTDLQESAGAGHWYTQLVDLNGDAFLDYVGTWSSWAVQSHFGGPPGPRPFWAVYFGNGRGFEAEPTVFGQCQDPAYPDPASTVCSNWQWEYTSAYSPSHQRAMDFADFNGDGLVDRFQKEAGSITLNAGPIPDLLVAVTTPLGAGISFDYSTSGEMKLGELPANPGMAKSRPVVSRRSIRADPNGPATVDEYHYAGGVFDHTLQSFLGFASVERRELSGQGDVIARTTRAVDRVCAGRTERVAVESPTGVLRDEALAYLRISGPERAADPVRSWHACLLETETVWALEGLPLAESRARRTEYDYGPAPEATAYNVLRIDELGEVDPITLEDLPGDERSTRFEYTAPNLGLNLVSKLSARWVEDPAEPGVRHAHTRFYYDGLAHAAAPTRGALSAVERWYANPEDPAHVADWLTVAEYGYDAYGNLASRSGAAHETATGVARTRSATVRDTVFATFPIAQVAFSDDPNAPLHVYAMDYTSCGALAPPPALGLACVQTLPSGVATTYGFDALGRVRRVDHPGGIVETRVYTVGPYGASTETSLAPPAGPALVSKDSFDGLGRAIVLDRPGRIGETLRVERAYDARGRLASETAPYRVEAGDPVRTRFIGYDGLGRTATVLESDAETLRSWAYAPWSVTNEVWFGAERQELRFRWMDAHGRHAGLTRYVDASAAAQPRTVTAAYDVVGRLLRVDDPIANGAACAESVYCPSQLHSARFTHDSLGRRVRIDDPDSGVERFRYDAAGLVQERTDANGVVESTRYDALGRVVARSYAGSPALDARFAYQDAAGSAGFGQLVRVEQPASGVSYAYTHDAVGRIATVEQHTADLRFENAYSWDAFGRIATRSFPDGERYDHLYNGTRLVSIEKQGAGGFDILLSAEYDAAGRATSLEIGRTNLLDPASAAVTLQRDYDPATGRLLAMRAVGRNHEADPNLSIGFEFDGLGRLVSSGTRSFRYDGLSRLSAATGPWEQPQGNNQARVTWSYAYDALGNLRSQSSDGTYSRTWEYKDPVRPRFLTRFRVSVAGIPYDTDVMVADPAGNPVRIDDETLVWNAMNRLVYRGDPWTSGVRYYDAFGMPVMRWFLGTELIRVGGDFEYDTGLEQGTKYFFVNGERIASRALEFDAQSAAIPAWVYRFSADWFPLVAMAGLFALGLASVLVLGMGLRPPAWVAGTAVSMLVIAVVLYPLHLARGVIGNGGGPEWHGGHGRGLLVYGNDALGSTRVVLDARGNTVETRDYAPYGMTIAHRGEFDLKHRFTGQPHDDRNRLYDYGGRMYDPRWSRFLTPDEITQPLDPQRANRYAYVYNRPTSLVDPDGRFAGPAFVAATAGFVAGTAAIVVAVSDDPQVDLVAGAVVLGAGYIAITAATMGAAGPVVAGPLSAAAGTTLVLGVLASQFGFVATLMGYLDASRDITIRVDGVDASAYRGMRGGIRRIEIHEGSVDDIRNGRIVFNDGSSVEVLDGQASEQPAEPQGTSSTPAPEAAAPKPGNQGRGGQVGSHSLRAVGAHGGGNVAQTAALSGWIAEGVAMNF